MLITNQVATAPCTDPIQECFRLLRQSFVRLKNQEGHEYYSHIRTPVGRQKPLFRRPPVLHKLHLLVVIGRRRRAAPHFALRSRCLGKCYAG